MELVLRRAERFSYLARADEAPGQAAIATGHALSVTRSFSALIKDNQIDRAQDLARENTVAMIPEKAGQNSARPERYLNEGRTVPEPPRLESPALPAVSLGVVTGIRDLYNAQPLQKGTSFASYLPV